MIVVITEILLFTYLLSPMAVLLVVCVMCHCKRAVMMINKRANVEKCHSELELDLGVFLAHRQVQASE